MKTGDKTKKIALVTGAAGFIGSHLCDALIQKKYGVVGLVFGNKDNIKHLKKNENFNAVECDITNFKEVSEVFRAYRPQCVFHAAAIISQEKNDNPFPFFETNVKGALNLLEACRIWNVGKFIYSSSMSVYGKNIEYLPVDERHPVSPDDFYGFSKLQAEGLCGFYARKYKIKTAILRYAGVYGPRRPSGAVANFIRSALDGKPLKITDNIRWDVVYVKDVAAANLSAFEESDRMEGDFEIINIGGGKILDIKDAAREIIKISGSRSKVEFNESPVSFEFYQDIAKAKKLLDFHPRSFSEGLEDYIKVLKNKL